MSRKPKHDGTDDGGPAGGPIRNRFAADRTAVLDADLRTSTNAHLLTPSRSSVMGSGDQRPPVLRPGCMMAASLPSRVGRTLRWPDGRVTPHDAPRYTAQDRADVLEFISDLMFAYRIAPSEVAA